jgi:hypothetical protein
MRRAAFALPAAALLLSAHAFGQAAEPLPGRTAAAEASSAVAFGTEPVLVDRAVAGFFAPDTGGVKRPHFVYERVLAFEARLEALADPDRDSGVRPYRSRHVVAALERHVAETLLASLHIDPEPTAAELTRQMQGARARLVERVGGEPALAAAMRADGMGGRDVYALLRRQALASLYLDRMVAPMLAPTDEELRALHARGATPFRDVPYVTIRPRLERWYTARKLVAAVQAYYQNARGRLTLVQLGPLPGEEAAEGDVRPSR